MKLHIRYCGYLRNDGTYNEIYMDTETNRYWDFIPNNDPMRTKFQFIEAYMSRDVTALRRQLRTEGWACCN